MKAEFIFDTVCPWCYIGFIRFIRALERRPNLDVAVRWTPFMLNPDMPLEGMSRALYLERKFGGPTRVQRLNNAINEAAATEQLGFNLERIERTPNSLHSHRLIKYAALHSLERPVIQKIFNAYFNLGIDVGQIEELITLGMELGLAENKLADHLYSDQEVSTILSEDARTHRLGVNGVPCLIFENRFAISGAQEIDVLVHLLDLAAENQFEPVSG